MRRISKRGNASLLSPTLASVGSLAPLRRFVRHAILCGTAAALTTGVELRREARCCLISNRHTARLGFAGSSQQSDTCAFSNLHNKRCSSTADFVVRQAAIPTSRRGRIACA
jgi:hypothetical protein